MKNPAYTTVRRERLSPEFFRDKDYALHQGILKLLAIKDSDIRLLTLEQSRDAVDKGLHAGGAFSSIIPLVALFYGGFLRPGHRRPHPPRAGHFHLEQRACGGGAGLHLCRAWILRPQHPKNSRSFASILNGHPGPILPGVHIATGPMGQGFGVAQGFAIAGHSSPRFDSYCMTGDGELQEGPIWEAVMYAGQNHLDNLCVLVDRNNGQLDLHTRMIFPMPELETVFRSFGWQALHRRCHTIRRRSGGARELPFRSSQWKAHGDHLQQQKGLWFVLGLPEQAQSHHAGQLDCPGVSLQSEQRQARMDEFALYCERLSGSTEGEAIRDLLFEAAHRMHLEVDSTGNTISTVVGPGAYQARSSSKQAHRIRRQAVATNRSQERICSL